MFTDKGYAFHEGYSAYYAGLYTYDNPYQGKVNEAASSNWYDWCDGYDAAYLQDNRTG